MSKITRLVIIIFVCILAVAAILVGKNQESANTNASPAGSNLPRLLDLGSHTCTSCRMMVPELDALSEEYEGVVDVEFIDVNENPNAAEPYLIRLIPTQIIFDADGNELFRHEGYMSREDMAAKLLEFGYIPSQPQD
ncbi:MAG: thioredoxin family protein [Candidatus Aegiribacteria sp.]|nr:thioredoxin family protein [Candidatus Aegiribacteria sp.]